jgi:hypothetical protein
VPFPKLDASTQPFRPCESTTSGSPVVTVRDTKGVERFVAIVVLLILAALWAAVLVPPLLRARSERIGGDSIDDFNYRLGVLGRTNGSSGADAPAAAVNGGPVLARRQVRLATPVAPLSPSRAAKRRRDVFTILMGAVAATFLFAYVGGGAFLWGLNAIADVLLLAYVGLFFWVRTLALEREHKVHYLPRTVPPELVLRRTASS